MKKFLLYAVVFFFCFSTNSYGQMVVNGKTLAGNEWIDYSQTYYKIKVGSDGMYRVLGSTLASIGIDIKNTAPSRYQLWQGGKEQALLVSTNTNFTNNDYLEFYGSKHRIQLDSFMYSNWKNLLLNTEFSLCNDTATYYLMIATPGVSTARIKDIVPNYNTITTPEINSYLHKEKLFFKDIYYTPLFEGLNKIKYSNFVGLEGFSNGPKDLSSIQINSSNVDESSSLKSAVRLRFGLNVSANISEVSLNGNLLGSYSINNKLHVLDTTFALNNADIKATNTIEIKNVGLGEDRNLLAVAEINYPRKFIFESNKTQFVSLGKGKNFFTFTGIGNTIDDVVYGYALASGQRVKFIVKDNKKKLYFENPIAEDIILYSNQNVNFVVSIEKKNFKKYNEFTASYLTVTSSKFEALAGVKKAVDEYMGYRQSDEGGRHTMEKVYVEDIYDEFGWGNVNHLQAFKNFTYYLRKNNCTTKYICLVGKGREYRSWRVTNNVDIDNRTFFIPTYGDYPSDEILFTQGNDSYSKFEIGRIAAENSSDLTNYFNKVKEFENYTFPIQSIDNDYWKKRFLHLSGGGSVGEQISIKNHLNVMKTVIETPQYGGDVSTFYKTTTDPIEEAISQKIRRIINSGISFITFFGHSGVGTWDINVEDPELWENKGKYPVITSLGCFSGNVHTQYKGIGEKYLFLKDKGGIAYLASSGSALLDLQGIFGKDMYNFLTKEAYGSTLGDLLGLLKDKYKSSLNIGVFTLNQQLTLLGDPALKLFGNATPDYTPDAKSLITQPQIIGSGDKTFDVNLDVYNLGRYVDDSLQIRVIFESFDRNDIDTMFFKIKSPASKSTVKLTIPNKGINSLGKNKLYIYLDPSNVIKESPDPQAEQNNDLVSESGEEGYEFYILDNTAKPIYPSEFSIVNKKPLFKVATSNAFAAEATYLIQVDTTELFNSPSLYTTKIVSKGGSFTHDANIGFRNNVVYYWRVSPDSINDNIGYAWQNSSFIYLDNSPEGWNQSHYFQYEKNPFNFIFMEDDRRFAFSKRLRNIEIVNGKYLPEVIGYKVDFGNPAGSVRPWTFLDGGIGIALINPVNGFVMDNKEGQYGSINTTAFGSVRCFAFNTKTKEDRKNIMDMLNNHVPDGFYVTLFSVYSTVNADLNTSEWASDSLVYGENLFSVLEKKGATEIRKLVGSKILPYSFIYKNNEGSIAEDIGKDFNAVINTKLEFPYAGNSGEHVSVPIGPVKSWKNVLWTTESIEAKDTISLSVIGIEKNGIEKTLIDKSKESNIDISFINAIQYPAIKLKYNCVDPEKRTVPYMPYWRVLADPLPDVELASALAFEIPDSVQQGQPITLKIGIANDSNANMDSLLTKYILTGESSTPVYDRIKPFAATEKLIYNTSINTDNLLGNYTLTFELNPDNDQLESNKFNNIGIKRVKVTPDRINPLMDVTFDGARILNEDIVAPKPIIKIELKDENKYLLLQNAQDFEVTLQFPDLKTVTYTEGNPVFKFIKANSGENNAAYVELTPELVDGNYLLTVRAKDASGNYSGNLKYEVTFKVITKQSVSNVLNYPNPFSNSTKFLFTVTGKIPQSVRIRIMTISGKVVKEITESEIGPIKIGQNMTQLTWDGSDDFGNRLANGVYLYQVIFKGDDGAKIDLFENKSIDKYIQNGIGKLVIIR